jgi:hypothetical protein
MRSSLLGSQSLEEDEVLASRDPYYALRDTVAESVGDLESVLVRFEGLLQELPGQLEQVRALETHLTDGIKTLQSQLKRMDKILKVVANAPDKFPAITVTELKNRREFVDRHREVVSKAKSRIEDPAISKQIALAVQTVA